MSNTNDPQTASISEDMNTSPSSEKSPIPTGSDLMSEMIIDQNSLDRFLDRDPHALPLTVSERRALIQSERARRTAWEIKREKAKAKKQGAME